jgi:carbonic anhydrase
MSQTALQRAAGRRLFLRTAALGGGLACGLLPRPSGAAGTTDVLLLSCMDFRLMDDVERYMRSRGLRDRYDHIVLAGASLGAVTDRYPHWGRTFWDHLGIALQLHQIHTVMLLDHRDCGAYKVILGPEHAATPTSEHAAHADALGRLRLQVLARQPALKVETLLMGVDGKVEEV